WYRLGYAAGDRSLPAVPRGGARGLAEDLAHLPRAAGGALLLRRGGARAGGERGVLGRRGAARVSGAAPRQEQPGHHRQEALRDPIVVPLPAQGGGGAREPGGADPGAKEAKGSPARGLQGGGGRLDRGPQGRGGAKEARSGDPGDALRDRASGLGALRALAPR